MAERATEATWMPTGAFVTRQRTQTVELPISLLISLNTGSPLDFTLCTVCLLVNYGFARIQSI